MFKILKIKKIFFISIAFIFITSFKIFAENINVKFSYGVNNIAKNSESIPIELNITNYDDRDFLGFAKINIYESNESVYTYIIDVFVKEHSNEIFNENIAISNKQNIIIIDIINDKEEVVTTERTSVDLSQNNDKLIIGALSYDFKSLSYIDDIDIEEYGLKIKLVEITEEKYERNKNILNCIDVLLISDINFQTLSDSFKFAINNFINSDKLTILSFGGNNGIFSMPDSVLLLLTGPSLESNERVSLPFGNKIEFNTKVTLFNLKSSEQIFKYGDNIFSERIKFSNGEIVTVPFSLNEFSFIGREDEYIKQLIINAFSRNRIKNIASLTNDLQNNDYYNIGNILNIVDKVKLPDIFILSCLLAFYVLLCSVFIYIYLRNIGKRLLYLRSIFIFSIIFAILMLIYGNKSMEKNVSLTYTSFVDINGPTTKEKAFLNFRVNESEDFNFSTNANNKLFPIIKGNNEAIMSTNFIDQNKTKITEIYKNNGECNVSVSNPKDFETNLFLYENSNYLNEIYNIDVNVSRFDNKITGRVTNKMGIEIESGYIVLFGKVISVGYINSNTSISLNRADIIGVPVGNNQVLSEIIGGADNNIVKYYFDDKLKGTFDEGYFLGFIDNNGTINIKSSDVGNIYGKTLLVKKFKLDDEPIFNDICVISNIPRNVYGNYDYETNSIFGDTDVILEYDIGKGNLVSNIYFEDIDSFDHGNIESSIPFYGEMQIYNYNTESFDDLSSKKIVYNDLHKYLSIDNKIIIRYYQVTRDPMYRKISLPIPRAIISKS